MSELILLLLSGLLLIAGIVVLQAGEGARWRRDLVTYRLQFPYGTKPEAVTGFVTGLAGLVAPRGRRWLAARRGVRGLRHRGGAVSSGDCDGVR